VRGELLLSCLPLGKPLPSAGSTQKQRHPEFQDALFVAHSLIATAVACACRLASAAVCWARVALEAEPACSLPVGALAAAHSVEDSAVAGLAHSAVAARVHCAAAAELVAAGSSLAEAADERSVVPSTGDRCVPVVPTGGSYRDDY
jgi:hypothetical protein